MVEKLIIRRFTLIEYLCITLCGWNKEIGGKTKRNIFSNKNTYKNTLYEILKLIQILGVTKFSSSYVHSQCAAS